MIATLPRTSNDPKLALVVLTPRLPLTSTITGLASPVVVPLSILSTLPDPAVDLSLSASLVDVTTSRAASDEPVVPRPTEPVATSRAAPEPD